MNQGLILIDIQNDYFKGGNMELSGMEQAANNAKKLLKEFRSNHFPVFHVQHISKQEGATFFLPDTEGAEINTTVTPRSAEPIVKKHSPNSFQNTNLLAKLKEAEIDEVIICGAMSHMCVDATTRAAFDLGFQCKVIDDACATRNLEHKGKEVKATDVHSAFMAALATPYADVLSTDSFLNES